MYLLILILPLLSAIGSGLFGRFLGRHGSPIFSTILLFITTFIALSIFYQVGLKENPTYLPLFNSIEHWEWALAYDSVTSVMLIVVTIVSSLVHLYSSSYMEHDPHLPRFMSYLSLFTFFMLILVTADNFIQLFIGWEGVGVCSYLLIQFWWTRIQANQSAIKAMIVNRVGDLGLLLAMFLIYQTFGTLQISSVMALTPHLAIENNLEWIGICLFIAAAGKSAQIGLHTWLPDAMEGPTPVSALIHAATMVTAGVYLIIRSSPLLEYAPNTLVIITICGALTAFFAASVGLVQSDMKKIIAYSTCSQLGYMIFACGLSNYSVSLFHLMNHAFFKALLFLSAGSVIHALGDEQDLRKMGGLFNKLPLTYGMIIIGSLSLMGFPFLTGFYSKDIIIESAYGKYSTLGNYAYILGVITAFLTAFYSFRLISLAFLTKTNSYKESYNHTHEVNWKMGLPLIILAFGSIFTGYLTKDMFIGMGTNFWNNNIYINPTNLTTIDGEFIPTKIKNLAVIMSTIAATGGIILYTNQGRFLTNLKLKFKSIYTFLSEKWRIDQIYNEFIVEPTATLGHNITYKLLDRGLFEYLGPTGITKLTKTIMKNLSWLQSGSIYNYALLMLAGILLYMIHYPLLFLFLPLILFLN